MIVCVARYSKENFLKITIKLYDNTTESINVGCILSGPNAGQLNIYDRNDVKEYDEGNGFIPNPGYNLSAAINSEVSDLHKEMIRLQNEKTAATTLSYPNELIEIQGKIDSINARLSLLAGLS
jgi:hypothetical protein